MYKSLRPVCGALLLAVSIVPLFAQAVGLAVTRDEQGILVAEGNQPVLYYQQNTKSMKGQTPRAGYVHPLYDLNGQVITEDFPPDHLHHRGVFWAWHQIWVGEQSLGDPWLCKEFQWDVVSAEASLEDRSVQLTAMVHWKSPAYADDSGMPIDVMRETTTITIYPREANFRSIDFDISLLALVDAVRIGGSDDDKGYGGFSPRIKLNAEQRFQASAGEFDPSKTAMDVGPWVDISGPTYGITMIAHSKNPGTPGQWILRRNRSMQNAVYPGRDPVELSTDTPTRLRYRLVIHNGELQSEQIESLFHSFTDRN